MVSASVIGELAGTTEIRESEKTLEFIRDNYVVQVNLETGKAQIGMVYDENNAYSLYKAQNFILSRVLKEKSWERMSRCFRWSR